jgi:hypothetical protein
MFDVNQVVYQTATMESGMLEIIYEGNSLRTASDHAIGHDGECFINHFRPDGAVRRVADYARGETIRGYVYE